MDNMPVATRRRRPVTFAVSPEFDHVRLVLAAGDISHPGIRATATHVLRRLGRRGATVHFVAEMQDTGVEDWHAMCMEAGIEFTWSEHSDLDALDSRNWPFGQGPMAPPLSAADLVFIAAEDLCTMDGVATWLFQQLRIHARANVVACLDEDGDECLREVHTRSPGH